jgi:hypothetical protein
VVTTAVPPAFEGTLFVRNEVAIAGTGRKLRWCWLQNGGAAVMLQEFRTEGHDSWMPSGKVGQGVTICFTCEDALAIYHDALAKGLQPSRPFVGNGMWVTSLADPDGYKLSFESLTGVAEETVYSG